MALLDSVHIFEDQRLLWLMTFLSVNHTTEEQVHWASDLITGLVIGKGLWLKKCSCPWMLDVSRKYQYAWITKVLLFTSTFVAFLHTTNCGLYRFILGNENKMSIRLHLLLLLQWFHIYLSCCIMIYCNKKY